MADIAKRFPENPILRPEDFRPSLREMKIECLLNPGAFRFEGKTCLLLRVAERPEQKTGTISLPIFGPDGSIQILEFQDADPKLTNTDPRGVTYDGVHYLTTLSHLRLVFSADGVHFCEDPLFSPLFGQGEKESYGIEDCRVTRIDDRFHLTFTAVSSAGVGVGMRSTTDWRTYDSSGMILPPHNKDCAIFDAKVGGRYFALHRPSSVDLGGNYIWIAESPDLQHWGQHRCLAKTRPGMWDSARVGAGAAPIWTPSGWLEIYHGANGEHRYCLGALLLDLEQPWKVLARSAEPIMEPITSYEQSGFFGNVVFTNGHVVDGDQITMYYGASDNVICGAHLAISEIMETLR